jgi:hypothetical protein
MTETAEHLNGLHLSELNRGSVIDLETKSRHYKIEYLGRGQVRVSGHPQWCPTPVLAQLQGSLRDSGTLEPDFVGCGMHLLFRRSDRIPVTTSEVTEIRLARAGLWGEMVDACKRCFGRR